MKPLSFYTTLCLVGLGQASGTISNEVRREFESWAIRNNKVYNDDSAKEKSILTWIANKQIVEEINKSNLTWTATVENQFGDITQDDFIEMVLMHPRSKNDIRAKMTEKQSQLPSSPKKSTVRGKKGAGEESHFDWRERGAVTPVHDQGTVGTCWAFSTIGNIEGQWFLSKGELVDLSEEYLVDCDGSYDESQSHADCSVFGGWPYLAYGFVIESGGVPSEEADPYCCGSGDCYPCMQGPISLCGLPPSYCDDEITKKCPDQPLSASISSWKDVSEDEDEIRTELVSTGPLSVLLDASQLQYYKEGVWDGHVDSLKVGCSKTYLNHAVLLTGYGEAVASEDGGAVDYWSVKNSWGQKWGEDGYFRIVRGEGTCGINTAVTTSFV